MGDNKTQSDKAPNNPNMSESGAAASRAGQRAGNQQSTGSGQSAGKQQDINQQQSIGQQPGRKQDSDKPQGTGSQQSTGGARQNQQHGGQHASGGTPALDDLNADLDSRNQGSSGSASRQMDQQSDWESKQDKKR